MHCPPGYGPRPVDTGWYAGFGQLERGVGERVAYAEDGSRFAGATFDVSGLYRLEAVLAWLAAEGVGPAEIHAHARRLQDRFLDQWDDRRLLPPSGTDRGNFLTFRSDDAAASYRALHDRGVITDYRGDRLRIGFGVYQDDDDLARLVETVRALGRL